MGRIFSGWAAREARLLQYHDDQLDEIYLLYHTYPSNIPHYDITPQELAEQSQLDHTGRTLSRESVLQYQRELRAHGYEAKARELDAVVNHFRGRKSITYDRANELLGLSRRRDTYDLLARLPEEQYKTWMGNAAQTGKYGREAYEIANGLDKPKLTHFQRDGYVNGLPTRYRNSPSASQPGLGSGVRIREDRQANADDGPATGCVVIVFALMAIIFMVALIA